MSSRTRMRWRSNNRDSDPKSAANNSRCGDGRSDNDGHHRHNLSPSTNQRGPSHHRRTDDGVP
jgi:hypothetical protein